MQTIQSPQSPTSYGAFPTSPVAARSPYTQYASQQQVYSPVYGSSPVFPQSGSMPRGKVMSPILESSNHMAMNCINISMSSNVSSGMQSNSTPMHIRCCDPYNQKVYDVPQYLVEDTLGKQTYTSNPSGRRAQICMKYQNGQCNMKARCQQIHAERAWVHDLRSRYIDCKKVYVSDIVALDTDSGERLAFKYSEVDNCPAKDRYRQMSEHERVAIAVCKEYVMTSNCMQGRTCIHLHVPPEKFARVLTAHVEKKEQQARTRTFSPTCMPMSPVSAMSPTYAALNINVSDVVSSGRSGCVSPVSPAMYLHTQNHIQGGVMSPTSSHAVAYPSSPVYPSGQWPAVPQSQCWSPTSPAYPSQPAVAASQYYPPQPPPTSPLMSCVIVPAIPPSMSKRPLPPVAPEHSTLNVHAAPVVIRALVSLAQHKDTSTSFSNMSTPRGVPAVPSMTSSAAGSGSVSSGNMRGRSLSRTSLADDQLSTGLHTPTSRSHSAPPVNSPSDGDLSIDSSVGNISAPASKPEKPVEAANVSFLGSDLRLATLKSQRSRSLNHLGHSGRN